MLDTDIPPTRHITIRCTGAGGDVGSEINIERARRVKLAIPDHRATKLGEAATLGWG
jgi:hypothetical protein